MSNLPVYNINVPGGGIQRQAPNITSSTPVYSSYTGNLVSHGNISRGTISDAPFGHSNYGRPFHVIEFNPLNNSYMTHLRR
jgi:hypothetical protein